MAKWSEAEIAETAGVVAKDAAYLKETASKIVSSVKPQVADAPLYIRDLFAGGA